MTCLPRLLIVIFGLASLPSAAMADSLATCAVSSSSVAFGTYNPVSSVDTVTTGSVNVSCNLIAGVSLLVAYTITLSPGYGTYAQRTLTSGSTKLQYNLYTNSGLTTIWGDGTSATSTVGDGYILGIGTSGKNYTVYAKMPALQAAAIPGSYADSIIVTITY